jgi:hypothetical protein
VEQGAGQVLAELGLQAQGPEAVVLDPPGLAQVLAVAKQRGPAPARALALQLAQEQARAHLQAQALAARQRRSGMLITGAPPGPAQMTKRKVGPSGARTSKPLSTLLTRRIRK